MGSPTWQTDTLETGSFVLNRLPVWTDQRREGFNAEVSIVLFRRHQVITFTPEMNLPPNQSENLELRQTTA